MILVTGATGNVGGALLTQLCSAGQPVRALVRSAERGDALRGFDCEVVQGTYEDRASIAAALRGVDRVFVAAPSSERLADLEAGVLDVVRQTVPDARVVLLATAGMDRDGEGGRLVEQHRQVVQHLRGTGLSATVLAPTWFSQNLLALAGPVQEHGLLPVPFGRAALNHVDARDVAAVAAHVLTTDGHEDATYTVTGPQALTFDEVAALLSQVLGREVRYVDVPPEQARQDMVAAGVPAWLVDGMLELYASYGAGAEVTDEVEKATGRPPCPLEAFLREHAAAFR